MSKTTPASDSAAALRVLYSGEEQVRQNWLQIARVYLRFTRRIESALRKVNLTPAQFELLAILTRNEGISQQELADHLLVTKGNVCTVLDRMQKGRWVRRKPDQMDARAYRLYLTAKGKDVFCRAQPLVCSDLGQVMNQLSVKQQQTLQDLLEILERGMKEKERQES
ncbi:MAG TPA: MarR family transcriptional regulator [Phycisphaerae bacterium]|nr:MarR family transcriptional regulator [Phycisphaerae bacterium]